ncbi:hypothetical protein VPH35_081604 [Triticum aestivum]
MAGATSSNGGGSTSSGRRKGKTPIDLEAAMRNMKLKETELDDVIVGDEEIAELSKESRWLAVARVNTTKYFSAESFKNTMIFAWRLAHEPDIREADNNLFVVNKVMHQGPWIYRGLMVAIEEYDGKGKPDLVQLDRVHVWAQIHDTPELYRKEIIVDQLARRIGQVKSVEMNPNRVFEGNYVRVRAKIKLADPLVRFAPLNIKGEGRILLPVRYEKIGFFCEVCGVLGHSMEQCGDGVHSPEEVEYGEWMKATRRAMPDNQNRDPSWNRGNSTRGRGRARGGGRGRNNGAKKRSSEDAGLGEEIDKDGDDDLKDTAESPLKDKGVDVGTVRPQTTVSRKLNMDKQADESIRGGSLDASVQGASVVPPPPPPYVTPRDRKKQKQGSSPNKSNMDSVAGSSEERRRVQ